MTVLLKCEWNKKKSISVKLVWEQVWQGVMIVSLLSLVYKSFFQKWLLNDNYLYACGFHCVGTITDDSQALEIAILSVAMSLSLSSFSFSIFISCLFFRRTIIDMSLGRRILWLSVSNGAKHSLWRKGFIRIRHGSRLNSEKEVTVRCSVKNTSVFRTAPIESWLIHYCITLYPTSKICFL